MPTSAPVISSPSGEMQTAYRMRFLAEKHGLDPSDLTPLPSANDATDAAGEYIDIQEIVDAELQKKPGPAAAHP